MPAMGVARQLDAYNRLLRLLPQGPWVPRGALHRLFAPFPRQQECGLQVLEQMERYGVMPNAETRFLLLSIFGPRSRPVRKCQRMLYWLPRMKHANPHPLPAQLPPPGLAAACLGLRRIANDLSATISIYQVGEGDPRGPPQRGIQPHQQSPGAPQTAPRPRAQREEPPGTGTATGSGAQGGQGREGRREGRGGRRKRQGDPRGPPRAGGAGGAGHPPRAGHRGGGPAAGARGHGEGPVTSELGQVDRGAAGNKPRPGSDARHLPPGGGGFCCWRPRRRG
uniref:ECSIT N-terminal domain-containing protein n=1 Tax=Coturnix japonica TaxID=93934 RepID=A0A8C2SQU5_COTJA